MQEIELDHQRDLDIVFLKIAERFGVFDLVV